MMLSSNKTTTGIAEYGRPIIAASLVLAAYSLFPSEAKAVNCAALPNTLTNGTTADASQVMANFNSLRDCANNTLAPAASPSFTGNVGIGTTSAEAKLDLNGVADQLQIKNGSDGRRFRFSWIPAAGDLGRLDFKYITAAGATSTWASLLDGKLGIGTASPGSPLEVYNGAGSAGSPLARVFNDNNGIVRTLLELDYPNASWVSNTTPALRVRASGTSQELFAVLQNGKVGIGTANPSALLTIANNTSGGALNLVGRSSDDTAAISFRANGDASTYAYIAPDTNEMRLLHNDGFMSFYPGNSEKVRFTASGNVGIGTTSPSYKLHVNGTVAAVAWEELSDARLKKKVRQITDALAIVEKLRGVHFEWRTPAERKVGADLNLPDNKPQVGFIAQELGAVLPEAVTVAEGDEAIMSIDESKIVPVLVEAMKEQLGKIISLQEEVSSLRRQIEGKHAYNPNVLQRLAFLMGW